MIIAVISAVARNPALLTLLLGGGGLVAWRVSARQKRARELAEMNRQAEIYAARVQAIGSYYSMTAREFEQAIAWLCRRDGCPEALVTGKAGMILIGLHPLLLSCSVVKPKIRPPRIRDFQPGGHVAGKGLEPHLECGTSEASRPHLASGVVIALR